MKWILELKNRLFKEKTGENEENAGGNRILDALKMLKNQYISVHKVIGNLQVISFIKEKWYGGVEYHDLFLFYSDLNLDRVNKIVNEYYEILIKYEEFSDDFKSTKQILKQAKLDKSNIDLYEIDVESKELDKKLVGLAQRKSNIENWVTTMGYKKKNLIIGLDKDCDHLLALEYFKGNPRSIIIYILLCLIVGGIYWIEYYQYGFYSLLFVIGVVTWLYYELLKTISLKAVKKYVKANKELEAIIREDYRKAYNIIKSYGKEKNLEEPPKIISREALEKKREEPKAIGIETKEDLKPYPVQQEKQEQVYNPYASEWKKVFDEVLTKHKFKVPEFVKLETTEIHLFNIPTLTVDIINDKAEELSNFLGRKLYRVCRDYEGVIGRLAVEFETVSMTNLVISYNEVPKHNEEDSIFIGRTIKEWVSWNLVESPHAFVVGASRSGKSVIMRFMIYNAIKNGWLPLLADFKNGVSFDIFGEKGYSVTKDKSGFTQFTNHLLGEVLYRENLLSKTFTTTLNSYNEKAIEEGRQTLPRLLCVFDEYQEMNSIKDDESDIINSNMDSIIAKGAATGVHIVIGTQTPYVKNLGDGGTKNNIGCRIILPMNDEPAWGTAFGTGNKLRAEDRVNTNKIPDNKREAKGMAIVKGTGTEINNVIIKSPFMKDNEFNSLIVNNLEYNENSDYKLHSLENNEAEEYEEKPVSKVDIQKLEKFRGKYAKDNVVEIQEEYDTHSTDFDITDFIDL